MTTTDTYLKIVLTTIALCLVWLCAQTAWPVEARQTSPSPASERPQPVVIVGWGSVDANGRLTLATTPDRATDPSVPVRVMTMPPGAVDVRLDYSDAQPMPVGITTIRPAGAWEPIRSAVEPAPVRSRPGRE